MTDESWRDDAACFEVGDYPFFPSNEESVEPAKKLCRACPVRVQCLNFALSLEDNPAGVWGGTSVRERRRMRERAA